MLNIGDSSFTPTSKIHINQNINLDHPQIYKRMIKTSLQKKTDLVLSSIPGLSGLKGWLTS